MKAGLAAMAALGVLALSACSGSQTGMTPEEPGKPASSATASPVPQGMSGKVGDTLHVEKVDVTVEQYNPKVTTRYGIDTWQAVLVRTCAKTDGVFVSTFPWKIANSDGERFEVADSYPEDALKPKYPMGDETVGNGECVKGWITFGVRADQKMTEVRYAPPGQPAAKWMLG